MRIPAIIGAPEEADHFLTRHSVLKERLPNLHKAFTVAYERTLQADETDSTMVFYLSRLTAEEFLELLVLAGNGYGIAALKLLRGLFEKAVTARYLSGHPDKLDAFMDFHHVSQHKLINAVEESCGKDVLPKEEVAEARKSFADVKERFMIPDCKTCGTTRLNFTWTRLDFASMASKTKGLAELIVPAYYVPMGHLHSTPSSVLRRLSVTDDGIKFMSAPQRESADDAMITAHRIVLDGLQLCADHFGWKDVEEITEVCGQDSWIGLFTRPLHASIVGDERQ